MLWRRDGYDGLGKGQGSMTAGLKMTAVVLDGECFNTVVDCNTVQSGDLFVRFKTF